MSSSAVHPVVRFCHRDDGVELAYAVAGRGPPLVVIPQWVSHVEHAWSADSPTRRFWTALARDHTLVVYDQHGTGLSDRERSDFSLQAQIDDMRAVVEHAGLDRFVVMAASLSGPTAVAYAEQHPGSVSHLVLYGTTARGKDVAPASVRESIVSLVRAHWGLGGDVMADVLIPAGGACERDYLRRAQRMATSGETAAALLELFYETDVTELLSQISVPTLVLHRDKDRAVPHECGRQLAAAIPGAQFVTLEGRNHPVEFGDWEAALDAVRRFVGHERANTRELPGAVFRREGDLWAVGRTGTPVLLRDRKGLRYLAHLLARPGREFHALDLIAQVEGSAVDYGDAGPLLDARAKATYRERVTELEDELSEARTLGDSGRAERAAVELEALTEELARAVGLAGRDREAASAAERARVKVTRLLRESIRRIEEHDAELGRLLDNSVRTGIYCAYEPDPADAPEWRL